MGNWKYDKELIDVALPEVKQWLGLFTATEGSVFDDQNYNTDLIVPGRRIALRGRWVFAREGPNTGQNQFELYCLEYTIRTDRPSTDHVTELAKTIAGHGDWFFYYWVDNNTGRLVSATLLDLHALRPHLSLPSFPFTHHVNRDRSTGKVESEFNAYPIEIAGNRCKALIAHVYADKSLVTYKRRQLCKLSRFPDLHVVPFAMSPLPYAKHAEVTS